MLKPAIQQPLTKQEVKELFNFLSYHLGYVPLKMPKAHFCRTAKEFATLYQNYQVHNKELIDEINKECSAFFDPATDTLVFKGFSYHEGIELPQFIFPMSTVIHELLHFFQIATGTYGSYRILYEGTNDIISCFLMNDYSIDYKVEAVFAFNLVMELVGHDFWKALDWMKRFTVHSNKNRFVHREIKQCSTFAKYNPRKLLTALDANKLESIANAETQAVLTRYSLKRIVSMCQQNRAVIQL
jgi:hypothetical protein